MRETEVDNSASRQKQKIHICEYRGRPDLGQNFKRRERCRVGHQGQPDQVLYRAIAEPGPDELVFPSYFLLARMRRPVDAELTKVVETDGDGAPALGEAGVNIHAEARDGRAF